MDLALHKTSKMCIQGTSCQHHEFCATDSLLFIHKNKLDQIHYYLTLVRTLIYTYYNAFYHSQLDMVVKGSATSLISQQSQEDIIEKYQQLAKSSSLQPDELLPVNVSE